MASIGEAGNDERSIPLFFRDTEVGHLVVTSRPGSRLAPFELMELGDLARPVGAVLQAVASGEALQRSRHALVTAREEERRRVRRDLHDGLGPALAAARMKVDGARLLIDRDPAQAKRFFAAPPAVWVFPELTPREHEVLELVARGQNNSEIARTLGVSGKTVPNHVSNLFTKLQVADRAQAIVRARSAGLGREPYESSRIPPPPG